MMSIQGGPKVQGSKKLPPTPIFFSSELRILVTNCPSTVTSSEPQCKVLKIGRENILWKSGSTPANPIILKIYSQILLIKCVWW